MFCAAECDRKAAQAAACGKADQPSLPTPCTHLSHPALSLPHPPSRSQAAWLALLFVGYGFQRGLCAAGLPYDCDSADAADVFNSLTLLTFLGGALAWLAGVTNPARFDWLVAPRRAYLWIVYLAVLPAYSGIASIPAMRVSLATMDQWGPAPIILKVVGEPLLCSLGRKNIAFACHGLWLCLLQPASLACSVQPRHSPPQAAPCPLSMPCLLPNLFPFSTPSHPPPSRRDWRGGRGLPYLARAALRLHRGRWLGVCSLRQHPRPAGCGVPSGGRAGN